jgi:hypothetical protein
MRITRNQAAIIHAKHYKHENILTLIYIYIQGGDDQRNDSAGQAMAWEKVPNKRQRGCVVKGGIVSLLFTLIFLMSTSRSAFHGPNRQLVLAFDIGTTYSGISYRYANLQTEDEWALLID